MKREIKIFNLLMWKKHIMLLTLSENHYEEIMRRPARRSQIDTTKERRKNQVVRDMRGDEGGGEVRPYC